jgi:hypothetical protein
MVVGIDAAFESSGASGSIKEPRRDTQRANPIVDRPCGTDLKVFWNPCPQSIGS